MQDYKVISSQPMTMEPPGTSPVNGVTVRPMRDTPEDAAFAARLMVEAFRDKIAHSTTYEKLPIVVKISTAFYLNQEPTFYTRNFIAELDGKLVGLAMLKFKGDTYKRFMCLGLIMDMKVPDHNKCLLDALGVEEYARGKGVGKLLLDRAEYEARKAGSTLIYLVVITTNRAIRLYERQGYTRTETHRNCCYQCVAGPMGSYHIMEKPLT